MKKVCIVTDSTADLPESITLRKDVFVVPLTVTHDGKDYKDGVEIKTEELLNILKQGKGLPKTSQPNPKLFIDLYTNLINEGFIVISIHISSKVSGTFQCAMLAKDMVGSEDIHIFDSRAVSFGTGLLVVEVLKLIDKGEAVETIIETVSYLAEKVRVAFVVDDLKYLKDGGRLSSTRAVVGTLLNIKPIIHMEDGFLLLYSTPRGMKKAVSTLFDYFDKFNLDTSRSIAIGNVDCIDSMKEFKEQIEEKYSIKGVNTSNVGSVVAVYCGPGTLGIYFFEK